MGAASYPTAQNGKFTVPGEDLRKAIARRWQQSHAAAYGIALEHFESLVELLGSAGNWGVPSPGDSTTAQKRSFLEALHIDDLVLARGCARGNEHAWDVFLTRFRQSLSSAACAIARDESLGRELADSLYADLYGLDEKEGVRRSRFDAYSGRGSLAGWLRSILAQRFVDHYRGRRREVELDDELERSIPAKSPELLPSPSAIRTLAECVEEILEAMASEDRFLLSSYYLDGRRLIEIARVQKVHESTVSRRLEKVTRELRKCLLRSLERKGLSYAQATEALTADVRDLDIHVRQLLQAPTVSAFQRKGVLK